MNEHETLARVRKADELARVLREAGCTADAVLDLDDVGWALACSLVSERRGAPVGMPSDATRSLVWSALVEREKPLGSHLLDGIGTRG